MAVINATGSTGVFRCEKWLGLNEAPDGDTGLKMGEAAVMRNFRITGERHLQIRPGYAAVCTLAEGAPVRGMWHGYVAGREHLLAACGGHLWDVNTGTWACEDLGVIDDGPTHFFGFARKVYLLTGNDYYVWDGNSPMSVVDGYAPVVVTAAPPTGGGTLLERVNLLTGKRRARYSPDGEAKVFQLPESDISEMLYVDGTDLAWTADLEAGKVTFASAPPKGVNTLTFTWRKGMGSRERIVKMRFSEFYNGAADTRVFLYGDGTNRAVYSDLDENGMPNAEYFPDLNLMDVDSANTPITAMIRHYDRLVVYKTDGAYSTDYSPVTLENGTVTAAFYTIPVNREIGNAAPGQVRLVRNAPLSLHGRAVYEWGLANSGTRDERNAKRISSRVEATLGEFALERCITFDDERQQEFYIICGDRAVIYNYGADAWYCYTDFPANCMQAVGDRMFFGTPDGRIMYLSGAYHSNDGQPIDALWESGAMDFDADWKRKYSANIWVAIKPESQARITVTAQSDRKSDHAEKEVSYGLSTFANADFAHWSFGTNRKPQVQRVRLKVRKFTFCKLIFKSCSATATATVLGVDTQIQTMGNVK